jgi:hypothetical protein
MLLEIAVQPSHVVAPQRAAEAGAALSGGSTVSAAAGVSSAGGTPAVGSTAADGGVGALGGASFSANLAAAQSISSDAGAPATNDVASTYLPPTTAQDAAATTTPGDTTGLTPGTPPFLTALGFTSQPVLAPNGSTITSYWVPPGMSLAQTTGGAPNPYTGSGPVQAAWQTWQVANPGGTAADFGKDPAIIALWQQGTPYVPPTPKG